MSQWENIFSKNGKVFLKKQEDMDSIIELLKKEKVKTVLDLGCGTGRHTTLLAENGFDVTATDISTTGIAITKKALKEQKLSAQFKECSCYEKFPFKDNNFDALISTQVIHHNYHDKVQYCISEIERVVKPGGIIFITVSINKYKSRTIHYEITAPRTYVPLDGEEKGLPHYIYTKKLMKKDFKNFTIIRLFKDKTSHLCLLGKLKK